MDRGCNALGHLSAYQVNIAMSATLHGFACHKAKGSLAPVELPLAEVGPDDVLIQVESCGVCHSDIHLIDNDWGISTYPLVPGHEILGRVIRAGEAVPTSHGVGTYVGVGWQRGACLQCDACVSGRENMCSRSKATCVDWHGGYADLHVANWNFAFPMPEALRRPEAAPLLCGGITVYSPLREFVRGPGARVGVVGIGGLGHLAVKLAVAMGMEVTVFSSSESKRAEAMRLGAKHFLTSTDAALIRSGSRSRLDLVLVTANVDLPWDAYLDTLRADGTLCFVGVPPSPLAFRVDLLLAKRRRVAASPIGSRREMREMLNFCAQHDILAQSEIFAMTDAPAAVERVRANQVRYRAVLVHAGARTARE